MGRHWLLLPEHFPHSVVSFFFKDDKRKPGRSWRIRDYSSGAKVEYEPGHLPGDMTHEQILARARWETSAPTIDVDDPYWVHETRRLNQQHAGVLRAQVTPPPTAPHAAVGAMARVPILEEADLRRVRRGTALERMLTSPNSEDWVTWTVFRTLERRSGWWPGFLRAAGIAGLPDDPPPAVRLWRTFPSPSAYERASRARLAASSDAAHRARSLDPKPVEGDTEVDILLERPDLVWFLEAKLHSDLSPNTTYDPTRNQLARNIDVLLEQAGGRRPVMSILTLDRRPDRFYTQLVDRYRADPASLHALLPHRDRAEIDGVVADLRVLVWRDVAAMLGDFEPVAVADELARRIGRW